MESGFYSGDDNVHQYDVPHSSSQQNAQSKFRAASGEEWQKSEMSAETPTEFLRRNLSPPKTNNCEQPIVC
jgi:hypothetical protein